MEQTRVARLTRHGVRVLLGALTVALGLLLLDGAPGALASLQDLAGAGLPDLVQLAGVSGAILPGLLLAWALLRPAPAAWGHAFLLPPPPSAASPAAPGTPHRHLALTSASVLVLRL
jgi:hypothetical protein